MTPAKFLRKLEMLVPLRTSVRRLKNGNYVFKYSFFNRAGMSHDEYGYYVKSKLAFGKVKADLVKVTETYVPPGLHLGIGNRKKSFWTAEFKIEE